MAASAEEVIQIGEDIEILRELVNRIPGDGTPQQSALISVYEFVCRSERNLRETETRMGDMEKRVVAAESRVREIDSEADILRALSAENVAKSVAISNRFDEVRAKSDANELRLLRLEARARAEKRELQSKIDRLEEYAGGPS